MSSRFHAAAVLYFVDSEHFGDERMPSIKTHDVRSRFGDEVLKYLRDAGFLAADQRGLHVTEMGRAEYEGELGLLREDDERRCIETRQRAEDHFRSLFPRAANTHPEPQDV